MEEFSNLKKGSSNDKATFKNNLAEFQNAYRELKTELYMRRNQVTQLQTELEKAHHEIHTLRETLDKLKRTSDENKITMEMFMKRTQEYEPKYIEKRDALVKLQLQYETEASINNVLKEDLQKTAMEKLELGRKVEMLEEQRKRDLVYSNELTKKFAQIKSIEENIKNDIQKLREEQRLHVSTLSQQVDLAENATQKCREQSDCINRLKLEKEILGEQYIKSKAKADELEAYVSANTCVMEENLLSKVILRQFKKTSAEYQQQIITKNEIITSLNDNLCQEKNANLKLIKNTEKLETTIKELETTIKELETKLAIYKAGHDQPELPQGTPEVTVVKVECETVEIHDSQ